VNPSSLTEKEWRVKATVTIDLTEFFVNEDCIGDAIRDAISSELKSAVRQAIKKDRRFSKLVKESASAFFESVRVIRK
jgi:hypothetical protein